MQRYYKIVNEKLILFLGKIFCNKLISEAMNPWKIMWLERTRIKVFWNSLIFWSTAVTQEVKNLPETRKKYLEIWTLPL